MLVLNDHFGINFTRDPGQNIKLKKKDIEYHFAVYQYELPNSCHKYLLYQLKNGKETLLPETKQLDYVWLVQTGCPDEDAADIATVLRPIQDIQLAQILSPEHLKSLSNLIV